MYQLTEEKNTQVNALKKIITHIEGERRAKRKLGRRLEITTVGLEKACSCGFVLFMMGQHRLVLPSFQGLYHRPWTAAPEAVTTSGQKDKLCELLCLETELADLTEAALFRGSCQTNTGIMSEWYARLEDGQLRKAAEERHDSIVKAYNEWLENTTGEFPLALLRDH